MRWLHVVAVVSVVLLLLMRGKSFFREVYGREDAYALAGRIEGLLGSSLKILFFEVKPECVCSAFLDRAGSLDLYRGKEWVVKGYKGGSLLYELRVDATLGFSLLSVNLSYTAPTEALGVANMVLTSAAGGVYSVEVDGGMLRLSVWEPVSEACLAMIGEAEKLRSLSILAQAVAQAVMLTSLMLAVALPLPGVRKGRLAAVSYPLLLALSASSTLAQLQYTLGKAGLAPTARTVFQLLYNSALASLSVLFSLIAGAAISARGGGFSIPEAKDAAVRWLIGVEVGVPLTATLGLAYGFLEQRGVVVPIQLSVVENTLSVAHPWLAASLRIASSTLFNAVTFRYLLLLVLREVVKGEQQAAVLASAIYALMFIGYAFYPPHAGFLTSLALSLALCTIYLWRGLFAAAAAEYTLNVLTYALAASPLSPGDAILLALTPLEAPLIVAIALELVRRYSR